MKTKQRCLNLIREMGFAHVAYQIERHWNDASIFDVFNNLVYDHRGGRQGFPKEVMSAIMVLYSIARQTYPTIDKFNRWSETFYR